VRGVWTARYALSPPPIEAPAIVIDDLVRRRAQGRLSSTLNANKIPVTATITIERRWMEHAAA
jgi:hypothetical protein